MSGRVRVVEILHFLHIEDEGLLEALRNEGLFVDDDLEPDAAEELRVAANLMQELGVNPAGVEVALHLRRRLATLESRMRELLQRLAEEA
jgi:hypothetical protein